ncbi:hypothetical protein [Actinomadura sp. KC345]|nr:hypothetical protein [Actinomadura sp. KC345]
MSGTPSCGLCGEPMAPIEEFDGKLGHACNNSNCPNPPKGKE